MADDAARGKSRYTEDDPRNFHRGLLAPRYWGTWLLLGFLSLVSILPRAWVMSFGAWIGDQFRKRNEKRRRIVEVNLGLCFPDLSVEERDAMLVEHFRAYGRCLLDMGLTLWCSERRLRQLVDLEGFEEHCRLVAERPVLIITWHFTAMEISALAASLVGPSVSMMKPMHNPVVTWAIARGRCHLQDVDLVTREAGMRPLIRGLRQGRQGFLLPDEDFGRRDPGVVFVPFFGVPRAMLTTPGRIARAARAVVVLCAGILDPSTGRYRVTFTPPLEGVDGSDPEADAVAICTAMEKLLLRAPEQYLWTFRWFQSRPDGEPGPYDPVPPR